MPGFSYEIRRPGEPPASAGPFPPDIAADQAPPAVRVLSVAPALANASSAVSTAHQFFCTVGIAGYAPRISFRLVRGRIEVDVPETWNQAGQWAGVIAAAIDAQWERPAGDRAAAAQPPAGRPDGETRTAADLIRASARSVTRAASQDIEAALSRVWERLSLSPSGALAARAAVAELAELAAALAPYVAALRDGERKAAARQPLGAAPPDHGGDRFARIAEQLRDRGADIAAAIPAMEAQEAAARTKLAGDAEALLARFVEHNGKLRSVRDALDKVAEFLRERASLDLEKSRIWQDCRRNFIDDQEIGLDRCAPDYRTSPPDFTLRARLPGIAPADGGDALPWAYRNPADQ